MDNAFDCSFFLGEMARGMSLYLFMSCDQWSGTCKERDWKFWDEGIWGRGTQIELSEWTEKNKKHDDICVLCGFSPKGDLSKGF